MRAFVAALEAQGYGAGLPPAPVGGEGADRAAEELRFTFRIFAFALAFTLPLVVIMMVLPLFGAMKVLMVDLMPKSSGTLELKALLGFVLATPVQFGTGSVYYRRALAALRTGGANMEVLITLGTSVAYFYSLAAVIKMMMPTNKEHSADMKEGAMFFETAAMLITFVALGKWLEAYTKGKTGSGPSPAH